MLHRKHEIRAENLGHKTVGTPHVPSQLPTHCNDVGGAPRSTVERMSESLMNQVIAAGDFLRCAELPDGGESPFGEMRRASTEIPNKPSRRARHSEMFLCLHEERPGQNLRVADRARENGGDAMARPK